MWSLNFLRFLKSSLILTEKNHQWIMKFNSYYHSKGWTLEISSHKPQKNWQITKSTSEILIDSTVLCLHREKIWWVDIFKKDKPLLEKTVKYENLKKSLTLLDILFYRLRFLDRSTQIIDNVIWYKINLLTK